MWANAQCDGRPAEYRWRPLQKFRNSIPCTMPQTGWRPYAGVPCSNAANMGERKSWTQSEFCSWQNSVREQEPHKCIYSTPVQESAKHGAKLGWPPLRALTKPRRKTRWNLLGCFKLANRYQPLVGRRSPYCEDICRRYCHLTYFFRLSMHALVMKI